MAYINGKKTVTVNINTDVIANPELTGGEAELKSLQVSNVKYDIGESLVYSTTAPTANNTSGRLKIVVLSSEPATKYDGYLYIFTGA